jgi:hypothetical protein
MTHFLSSFRVPAVVLELLNGGAITPELLWLGLLVHYLVKESRRRGLQALDWFNLPPSMNLILAIAICDFGTTLRSMTIWFWRRFGGGDFTDLQVLLLFTAGAFIAFGTLCKIRALTEPDHGWWPWLLATGATLAVFFVLVALR